MTKNAQASLDAIMSYVTTNGSITNRACRQLLGISYDQSIRLLGSLSRLGILERIGVASGTKYVLMSKVTKETISSAVAEISKHTGSHGKSP